MTPATVNGTDQGSDTDHGTQGWQGQAGTPEKEQSQIHLCPYVQEPWGRARWEKLGGGGPAGSPLRDARGQLGAVSPWRAPPDIPGQQLTPPPAQPWQGGLGAGALLCIVCHLHLGGGCDGGVRMSCRRVICVQLSVGGAHHLGRDECQQGQPGGLQPFPSLPCRAQEPPTRPPSFAREHRGALGGRMVPLPTLRCSVSVLSSPQEPHRTERCEPLSQHPRKDPSSWEPMHQERGLLAASSSVGRTQGLGKFTVPRSPSHS